MGAIGPVRTLRRIAAAVGDLAVPLLCGGCGRPDTPWCPTCDRCLSDVPRALTPRVETGAPVWALGRYDGPLRASVLALKEHGRTDLAPVLGGGLADALITLARWGDLPAGRRMLLVPAPTRAAAARRRGGDPVTAMCASAVRGLGPRAAVAPLLVTAASARDSAGLGAGARAANLAGAVRLTRTPPSAATSSDSIVVLVDDVVTTGATAAASTRLLARAGVEVAAVLAVAGV
ncbi:ComF family protein [Gordonia humi]|uniref:Putative amidophosphoribosyltransferase n=1 Tax=Gordonia humi TaxID=686429 RepID=A0A840F540_9ACTN|nr:putative amidophosphoribosyltransferase [Gordonia humi]